MGAKQQPKIGADGRSYFTYGIGASWLVDTGTGDVRYQILGARYTDGEQSYLIAVTSAAGETLRDGDRKAYQRDRGKEKDDIKRVESKYIVARSRYLLGMRGERGHERRAYMQLCLSECGQDQSVLRGGAACGPKIERAILRERGGIRE